MFIQFITKETQDTRDTGKELQIDTWVFFHLACCSVGFWSSWLKRQFYWLLWRTHVLHTRNAQVCDSRDTVLENSLKLRDWKNLFCKLLLKLLLIPGQAKLRSRQVNAVCGIKVHQILQHLGEKQFN